MAVRAGKLHGDVPEREAGQQPQRKYGRLNSLGMVAFHLLTQEGAACSPDRPPGWSAWRSLVNPVGLLSCCSPRFHPALLAGASMGP